MKAKCLFLCLVSMSFSFANLQGTSIQKGPFELELKGTLPMNHMVYYDDPICYAIAMHKILEIILDSEKIVSDEERIITTKKIQIEPYLFGLTKEGMPVLQGNVIKDTMLREITVKFNTEAEEDDESTEKEKKSFFSGWFRSSKEHKKIADNEVNILQIAEVHVLENSNFAPPKETRKMFKRTINKVICEIQNIDSSKKQ